jgi:hypothetical protein
MSLLEEANSQDYLAISNTEIEVGIRSDEDFGV